MNRLAAILFFLFWSLNTTVQAQTGPDPSIQWEQIETPHFLLVYDSRHRSLGDLYARYAEKAFAATTPAFGDWPKKTVIVITDNTDLANGFATGVPYPMISVFPVLPTALDSISDYGNWGLELVTHEYTHILTFEPANGVMRPMRWIFGSIVRPNILLPRWYLEGLAVEFETRHSHFGRLRSANFLSIPRAMIEEKTLRQEDLSRINESSIPDWPGGIRPYLLGALLWNEMIRLGGDDVVGNLNQDYSRRVPFLINGPVETRLGKDYVSLLAQTYERLEVQVREQIERIQSAGSLQDEALEQTGFFNHSPVISPDGKQLAFVSRTHNVDSSVWLASRTVNTESFLQATPQKAIEGTFINRVSWLPNSSGFIYDSIDTYNRYYSYSDLWRYDLESRKKSQLTQGLRAKEPTVSPDGKSIVFVQVLPGSTQLASVDLDGQHQKVLYTPPVQTRISRPEFLSSSRILFAEKRDDGAEVFKILDLEKPSEPRAVLQDFRPAHFPRLTSEGLLFVSDRSGVANLYLANRDLSSARPVSNTTTRLMTGELDSSTGELLYSRLTSSGPLIHAASRAEWNRTPATLPQVAALVDNKWSTYKEPEVDVSTQPEPYSAWPHLLPRYWMPYIYTGPNGSYFQASTANSDPTGRHAYSLSAAYDTLTQSASYFAAYSNRTTSVPTTLTGEHVSEYIQGGWNRDTTGVSLVGKFYLPGLGENWSGGLGARYLSTDLLSETLTRGGISASVAWSNATQKGLEISPEKGGSFSLTQTQYIPDWGNISYEQTSLRGTYYFSKWLPERHALALSSQVTLMPRLNRNLLGQSTYGGSYQSAVLQGGLLMRGYDTGTFIGRNLVSATAEYRFPIAYVYRGFGTTPFFIQRVHGDVFVDALSLDGIFFDPAERRYRSEKLGRVFMGSGVEFKADTTMFYHLPVQFTLGLYYGFDRQAASDGPVTFIGIGY